MSSLQAALRAAAASPEIALRAAVAAEVARRAAVTGSGPAPGAAGAVPEAAAGAVSAARAAASRQNGARSRGPVTPEGKARSSQNALKHGLCARQCLVLAEEDPEAFCALEAALLAELAPKGALQTVLALQIVSAAWRLHRADRLEGEIFAERRIPIVEEGGPGLQMIRDGNCSRSFDTLVRYRGAALAELTRCLKTLRALQAEAQAGDGAAPASENPNEPETRAAPRRLSADPMPGQAAPGRAPHEPRAPWIPNEPRPGAEPGVLRGHEGAQVARGDGTLAAPARAGDSIRTSLVSRPGARAPAAGS
jgi:hypothetical protein